MRSLDVGIIGCGTAGSAAALFLARAGHRVTVYERVPTPTPVGAGITLQPTGQHVLSRLGLYAGVRERGSPIDSLVILTKKRRPILELSYDKAGPGLFGLGLHRGVLFEALFGAVEREPGVTLRTGVEVVDLARTEQRTPSDPRGSWFVGPLREDGGPRERYGPHELVVVADGARSQLRDDTNTSKTIARYPWGALWFVAEDVRERSSPEVRRLHQVVDGNHTFFGMLPSGCGPRYASGLAPGSVARSPSTQLVSLFWSLRGDAVDAWRSAGLEPWKEKVRALAPESGPLLEQIHDQEQMLFAAYHDVVMHRWHTRNVVYLGDAAHATSPQLGQGCNLALWDAMELADCLAAESHDLARALATYSRKRHDHLAFYQLLTRWLTPFFQGDVGAFGDLRDFGMPLMARLPPVRWLMTHAMLGVMDGFTGRRLALDLPQD